MFVAGGADDTSWMSVEALASGSSLSLDESWRRSFGGSHPVDDVCLSGSEQWLLCKGDTEDDKSGIKFLERILVGEDSNKLCAEAFVGSSADGEGEDYVAVCMVIPNRLNGTG